MDDDKQPNENTDTSNPDPGYPSQATVNARNPDQQQNRGERPRVQQEQDESVRKAETKKAVQEDKPDKSKGNENTQFSGKS